MVAPAVEGIDLFKRAETEHFLTNNFSPASVDHLEKRHHSSVRKLFVFV